VGAIGRSTCPLKSNPGSIRESGADSWSSELSSELSSESCNCQGLVFDGISLAHVEQERNDRSTLNEDVI
jgi:hypothetical protein